MKPTPAQEQAIKTQAPRICVSAGAGSGKTRVLIERILNLLKDGKVALEEIVAITFTEKAAAEMKDRMRKAFRNRAPQGDAEQMSYWRDLERRVDHARISTIHGFCSSILRENALRLGLDPDFSILLEADSVLMTDAVVRDTFHALLDKGEESACRLAEEMHLNALQGELLSLLQRPHLVARLAERFPFSDPEALRKAWAEEVEKEHTRQLSMLGLDARVRVFFGRLRSFDGICEVETDGREQLRVSMIGALSFLIESRDAEANAAVIEPLFGRITGTKKANWPTKEVLDALSKLQKDVRDFLKPFLTPPLFDPEVEALSSNLTRDMYAVFHIVETAYQAAKQAANVLDFDDLIAMTVKVLKEDETLRIRVASQIRHLMMDEFQDTDGGQLEIARLLTKVENGPDLFIVGDVKQSIYYFRGAEVEVFQEEEERAEVRIALQKNFRTLPEVMLFINDFFSKVHALDAVEAYQPMEVNREATGDTRVACLVTAPPEDEKWTVEPYRRHEAEGIADRILQLCSEREGVQVHDETTGGFRKACYGDVALLFRSTSNVYFYEEALRRRGIPYVLVAGAGFYRRQEVVDLINLLKVVVDPWDEEALFAFLRSPMAGLRDDALFALVQNSSLAHAFWNELTERISASAETMALFADARALLRRLKACTLLPLPVFLAHVLEETAYEAVLLGGAHGVQKAANIRKLMEIADSFAAQKAPTLTGFIHYLEMVQQHEVREGEAALQTDGAGAVTLMTVHKSKGLEFPVVFIPDMARKQGGSKHSAVALHRDLGMTLKATDSVGESVTPALTEMIKERIRNEEGAEHARLLYVALTRARDYLVLCGTDTPASGSWFELLEQAFDVLSLEDSAVFVGEGWQAQVWRRMKDDFKPAAETIAADAETLDLSALRRRLEPVISLRSPDRTVSVSAILDHMAGGLDLEQERKVSTTSAEVVRDFGAAALRGTLAHRLFELWDFKTSPTTLVADLMLEAGVALSEQASLKADLLQLARRFGESALAAQLRDDAGLEREAPFVLRLGEMLVSGTVDAFLSDGTIVDYKTGRFDETRHARYEWQLLLYAGAVRKILGKAPRKGVLYYLDEARAHEVFLGDEEVAWALQHAEEVAALL